MYTRRADGSTGCVPENLRAEEKRLSHLVNDLNRAMFAIRYQSLDQPPATPDTMTTRSTPTGLAAFNDTENRLMSSRPMPTPQSLTTSLRGRNMAHSTMTLPPSEQAHIHMPALIAVNANAPTATITTTGDATSNRRAVMNDAMRHERPTTATTLMTNGEPIAEIPISAHIQNVHDGTDGQQNE
jgi:hypothetical protein